MPCQVRQLVHLVRPLDKFLFPSFLKSARPIFRRDQRRSDQWNGVQAWTRTVDADFHACRLDLDELCMNPKVDFLA